jgi:hypothetical protein
MYERATKIIENKHTVIFPSTVEMPASVATVPGQATTECIGELSHTHTRTPRELPIQRKYFLCIFLDSEIEIEF